MLSFFILSFNFIALAYICVSAMRIRERQKIVDAFIMKSNYTRCSDCSSNSNFIEQTASLPAAIAPSHRAIVLSYSVCAREYPFAFIIKSMKMFGIVICQFEPWKRAAGHRHCDFMRKNDKLCRAERSGDDAAPSFSKRNVINFIIYLPIHSHRSPNRIHAAEIGRVCACDRDIMINNKWIKHLNE